MGSRVLREIFNALLGFSVACMRGRALDGTKLGQVTEAPAARMRSLQACDQGAQNDHAATAGQGTRHAGQRGDQDSEVAGSPAGCPGRVDECDFDGI